MSTGAAAALAIDAAANLNEDNLSGNDATIGSLPLLCTIKSRDLGPI